ncbi:tRNA (adenosine(37)-N6)-threonylcarbamoyltransferase complex dimerization subunit type 1 TsaB [bacterium]|nr:tRNA (adenosine(37)-N6)-threonylcarbamoyltransferase complex dimerization subunit type 1 TsaB [bacterium]
MKNFLSINTSQENMVEVILFFNGNFTKLKNENRRECLKKLIPMISEILSNAGATFDSIDFIGLNKGPGSWTGLRIGYATIKVLCLVKNIPVIEYDNFEIVKKYFNVREGIILLKSSNDNYYFSEVKNAEITHDGIISESDLFDRYKDAEKFYLQEYSSEFLKEVLDEKFFKKNFSSINDLEPYYVSTGLYKEHRE